MAERNVKITLEAGTKGVPQAKKDFEGLADALDMRNVERGAKAAAFQLNELFRQTRGLATGMRDLNQQIRGGGGGNSEFGKLAEEIRDAARAMTEFAASRKKAQDEQERSANKRGFGMGVLQGAGVGEYFPEHGLSANVAGRAVGSGARRAAGMAWGATGGSAFNGLSGLQGALAGIPVVGGLAAAGVGNLAAQTGQALNYEQVRYAMRPYQGSKTFGTSYSDNQAPVNLNAMAGSAAGAVGGAATSAFDAVKAAPGRMLDMLEGDFSDQYFNEAVKGIKAKAAARKAARESVPEWAKWDSKGTPVDAFGMMAGVGGAYGMNASASAQFGGQLVGAAGGTFDQLTSQSFAHAAAMQGRYGVGADVSGAFMRGGRLGGTSGNQSENALRQAVTLGLEGSDLQKYMQQMAEQISEWDQTGMPLDVKSTNALAGAIAGTGVGGVQGARIAGGIADAGREIGASGPKDAMQFFALRTLYGYQGGGMKDFHAAKKRASKNEIVPGGLEAFLTQLAPPSLDPETRAEIFQQGFGQLGITVGPDMADQLAGSDPAARRKAMADIAAGGTRAAAIDLDKTGTAPGAVQTQAAIDNTQMGSGSRALKGVQDFEMAQAKMTRNMAEFTPILEKLGKNAEVISTAMGPAFHDVAAVLSALVARVF